MKLLIIAVSPTLIMLLFLYLGTPFFLALGLALALTWFGSPRLV